MRLERPTSLGHPNPPLVFKKHVFPWMGGNLALFGPCYEDKAHSRPACTHHSVQNHANLSFPAVKLTVPEHDIVRLLSICIGKRRYGRGAFVSRPLDWAPKSTLGCSFSFENQYNSLDGEQSAPRVIHFSLQVPLECTCNADLWSKSFETSLSCGKTDLSLCIRGAP